MLRNRYVLVLSLLLTCVGVACAQKANEPTATSNESTVNSSTECKPIDMGSANASEQKPAFKGQTRACEVKSKTAFDVVVIASGLSRPWAVEPLPDGDFLITEKPGAMRIVSADGKVGEPIKGVLAVGEGGITEGSKEGGLPPITASRQGGLLDVALSPSFKDDSVVFWSFSEKRTDGSGTSVARGVLDKKANTLKDVKVIFRALPSDKPGLHFGSRIAFGDDGKLYVTTGDRFNRQNRLKVQKLDNHLGKVMRINLDGSVPKDNPFVGKKGALPEIWDFGHRNIQSAAFDSKGQLWTVEHGARGGDELNLVEKGKNFGWPLVTYGQEYSGNPIPNAVTKADGFVQPVYYWDPVIAPSGMEVYSGEAFPEWKGNIFIGGLRSNRLVRVILKDNKVVGEEHLLVGEGKRIRDVRQGPKGALYVVTDARNGELIKISPKK